MAEINFTVDTSIYDDREYLRDSYQPEEIVGRDEELEDYQNALLPVVNGEEPNNIFLYGKTGVGKTVCTELVLNELQQQSSDYGIGVTVLSINCDGLSSSYQVAIRLINQIRPMDEQMAETGHTAWKVYETLFEELDSIGGTILVVLDEIDSLDDDHLDGIFYQLPRARSNGYLDNAKVGVIGISSDLTLKDSLAPDVRSTLCEKEIEFDSYDASELTEVLEQRAEKAFYDDALQDRVINLCAALAAKDGGDARRAIGLLREAGDLARQENADQVTEDHVERAREKIKKNMVLASIQNLQENEKITLYALASLTYEGVETPRSTKVYERYEALAENSPHEPVTVRRLRDYLKDFDSMNLTERNDAGGGTEGNYQIHELNSDVDEVLSAIKDTIEMCGVHPSIKNHEVVDDLDLA